MKDIDWSKQHCGIHQGLFADVQMEMSDVAELILETFPENVSDKNMKTEEHAQRYLHGVDLFEQHIKILLHQKDKEKA